MRDRIKEAATDLLIQRGYRGVSFGDLSTILSTTRANIHYHFGDKKSMVEEVLEDYVRETSKELSVIWTNEAATFAEKIEATIEHNRKRYVKYNPRGHPGNPWGLISRLRQDSDALSPSGRATLHRFGSELHRIMFAAIEHAKAQGEFISSMPSDEIALQLASISNSAGPVTQDAGNFERLEQLYLAFAKLVVRAYGAGAAKKKTQTRRVTR